MAKVEGKSRLRVLKANFFASSLLPFSVDNILNGKSVEDHDQLRIIKLDTAAFLLIRWEFEPAAFQAFVIQGIPCSIPM